jgi:hypothetical protein
LLKCFPLFDSFVALSLPNYKFTTTPGALGLFGTLHVRAV